MKELQKQIEELKQRNHFFEDPMKCLLSAVLLFGCAVYGAEPEPLTAEQRKEVVERYKHHITEQVNSELRLSSLASRKAALKTAADPKRKAELQAEIKALEDPQANIIANPVKFGPFLTGGIAKGAMGIFPLAVRFKKIVDKNSAVVTVVYIGTSSDVLLEGFDTSKFSDDTRINLWEVWYCAGNTKVGEKTIFRMVSVVLTADEIAELKAFKPVIAKKK